MVPTTPPKNKYNTVPARNTPHRTLRVYDQRAFEDLKFSRDANADDIGAHVPEISLETFFSSYVPRSKAGLKLDDLARKLEDAGFIDQGSWTAFPASKPPKKCSGPGGCENEVYAALDEIVNKIGDIGQAVTGIEPFIYRSIPNSKPRHSLRETDCRPDGAIMLKNSAAGRPSWEDMVVLAEYKKQEDPDEVNKNIKQILFDLSQAMRDDARRNWVRGFTIENLMMRIWYVDRSQVLVSEAFDINTQKRYFIRFFASILFATEAQLGLDPTMKRVTVKELPQYNITVHISKNMTRRFQTIALLSGARADALRGRSTRVWECIEIDEDDKPIGKRHFALKDTWIDKSRQREGSIIEELRSSKHVKDDKVRKTLDRMLLTVACHGDVLMDGKSTATKLQSARTNISTKFLLKKPKSNEEKTQEKVQKAMTDIGSPNIAPAPSLPTFVYEQKVRYRCVFQEVGRCLDDQSSLHNVFKVIGEVVEALNALHKAGWVHRDISSTNILVVNGMAKLADLEYAKKHDAKTCHPVRSGMPFFTAVEVATGEYLFEGSEPELDSQSDNSLSPIQKALGSFQHFLAGARTYSGKLPILKKSALRLVYRPLHDLESLWWVAVYFVVNREVGSVGGKRPCAVSAESAKNQESLASNLLRNQGYRGLTLTVTGKFEKAIQESLHPSILPAAAGLVGLRDKLVEEYRHAERDILKIDFFKMVEHGDLHWHFQNSFYAAAAELLGNDVGIYRYNAPDLKRKLEQTATSSPSKRATRH
ncbi:hypothetical protein EIP86_006186 [Pleurotus ostreatoroseus]|nr:hypothetical protein EIP86_006186 [Pleurotus ostreatoroseus]